MSVFSHQSVQIGDVRLSVPHSIVSTDSVWGIRLIWKAIECNFSRFKLFRHVLTCVRDWLYRATQQQNVLHYMNSMSRFPVFVLQICPRLEHLNIGQVPKVNAHSLTLMTSRLKCLISLNLTGLQAVGFKFCNWKFQICWILTLKFMQYKVLRRELNVLSVSVVNVTGYWPHSGHSASKLCQNSEFDLELLPWSDRPDTAELKQIHTLYQVHRYKHTPMLDLCCHTCALFSGLSVEFDSCWCSYGDDSHD